MRINIIKTKKFPDPLLVLCSLKVLNFVNYLQGKLWKEINYLISSPELSPNL